MENSFGLLSIWMFSLKEIKRRERYSNHLSPLSHFWDFQIRPWRESRWHEQPACHHTTLSRGLGLEGPDGHNCLVKTPHRSEILMCKPPGTVLIAPAIQPSTGASCKFGLYASRIICLLFFNLHSLLWESDNPKGLWKSWERIQTALSLIINRYFWATKFIHSICSKISSQGTLEFCLCLWHN